MSDSPRTFRKRNNMSATSPARWTDEDRALLWQLRQEQSHLTWTQLYNVVGPRFPGRSKSAITQECQRMEREDAKRRMLLIKERRSDHTVAPKQGKRPICDQADTAKGRLSKEPRLDDHAGEQSSDDGGDIEYDGRKQPTISRQSPNAPHPRENSLHSSSSVQSPGLPRPNLPKTQSRPQPYLSPKGVETPVSEQAPCSTPDLPPYTHAPQIRPDGGPGFLPSQTSTHAATSSISSGDHEANHAVGTAKSAGSTPQGDVIPKTTNNEGPHPISLNHPKSSHPPVHLPPKPPTPQPTPSQPPASHPPAQAGGPNKQYIETLTGDQCLDGAVHLLSRLTQIRIKEGLALGAKLNENAALKLRIEELESQQQLLSAVEQVRNAKLLAMEKEMEKMREESKATAQRLDEVCRILGILGVAATLLNPQSEQSMLPAGDGK